jgi:hypothetical protein
MAVFFPKSFRAQRNVSKHSSKHQFDVETSMSNILSVGPTESNGELVVGFSVHAGVI